MLEWLLDFLATVAGLAGDPEEWHSARVTMGLLLLCLLAIYGAFSVSGLLQAILAAAATTLLIMTVVSAGLQD